MGTTQINGRRNEQMKVKRLCVVAKVVILEALASGKVQNMA